MSVAARTVHDEAAPAGPDEVLRLEDVVKHFPLYGGGLRRRIGSVRAVDGVSLTLHAGETLGLVGESGCGKSTLGRVVLRLIEPDSGRILFGGDDVTHAGRAELRALRQRVQIVFQNPLASLNPRRTVRDIVAEPLRVHGLYEARGGDPVRETLELVGLPADFGERYPHELSGGQQQRVAIARSLTLRPSVLVLDEPVSALDVSIQAQVVNLLGDLQDELGLAYLFIAHDLAVVRQVSDRVAVMYLGKIVEVGARDEIYERPAHPYTKALLASVPVEDPRDRESSGRLILAGDVPNPADPPSGCRFRTRCWKAQDVCAGEEPALDQVGRAGRRAACYFPEQPGT